jgi:Flp pilus assembly CpaE family ATPase
VVLNKAGMNGNIKLKDVETTLGHKLAGILPVDYKLASVSMNRGESVVLYNPRSRIARSILDLSRTLNGAPAVKLQAPLILHRGKALKGEA